MKITPIIGLEIHIQIKTKTKAFCSCSADYFGSDPNTHTCPVCLGLPGALPVPGQEFVKRTILVGLALGSKINRSTHFDRKNYFYPDLPKGYQISQFYKPIIQDGQVKINVNGQEKTIHISEAHLEEDAAKSIHEKNRTLIDFNKSGVPLLEIVSEPEMNSSDEALTYAKKIQQIIRYLGVSDANIEEGSMRVEPTVNLKIGDKYTPLVEIKNIASLSAAKKAIDYEIKRQTKEFGKNHEEKSATNKTTRGWNMDRQETFLQREKEGSADYRYFPEPDIPPLTIDKDYIEKIRKEIPELPDEKIVRYQKEFGLSLYDTVLLTQDFNFAKAFEKAIGSKPSNKLIKSTANFFLGVLKKYLNEKQESIDLKKISPAHFSYLFSATQKGEISSTVARDVILESYQTQKDPESIIKEKNLSQVSDTGKIEELAKQVIKDNPKAVKDYQKNPNTIAFLIGQLMKLSKGSANPQLARETLQKLCKT